MIMLREIKPKPPFLSDLLILTSFPFLPSSFNLFELQYRLDQHIERLCASLFIVLPKFNWVTVSVIRTKCPVSHHFPVLSQAFYHSQFYSTFLYLYRPVKYRNSLFIYEKLPGHLSITLICRSLLHEFFRCNQLLSRTSWVFVKSRLIYDLYDRKSIFYFHNERCYCRYCLCIYRELFHCVMTYVLWIWDVL